MQLVKGITGTILLSLALLCLLVGFGVLGSQSPQESILDSPEASGRLVGGLLPALLLAAGGIWLWQKPNRSSGGTGSV